MITKPTKHVDTKENVASTSNATDSEREFVTTQDYKKRLQEKIYELESESMPAT